MFKNIKKILSLTFFSFSCIVIGSNVSNSELKKVTDLNEDFKEKHLTKVCVPPFCQGIEE